MNRRVTQIFVENALRGEPIVLHNGGVAKLDFTHVSDVADGFVRATLSERSRNRIYNITRGRGRSLKELAELVASLVPGTRFEEKAPDLLRPNATRCRLSAPAQSSASIPGGPRRRHAGLRRVRAARVPREWRVVEGDA